MYNKYDSITSTITSLAYTAGCAYLFCFKHGAVENVRTNLTKGLDFPVGRAQITPINSPRGQETGEVEENLRVLTPSCCIGHSANLEREPPLEFTGLEVMNLKQVLHILHIAYHQLISIYTIYSSKYISS